MTQLQATIGSLSGLKKGKVPEGCGRLTGSGEMEKWVCNRGTEGTQRSEAVTKPQSVNTQDLVREGLHHLNPLPPSMHSFNI